MTRQLLIQNGLVVDPENGVEAKRDVLITDGKIARVADKIARGKSEILGAKGKIVTPGLIDIHVHFREPGGEDAETIQTGAAAAVAGGFTTVCCMPNTVPALDNEAQIEYVLLLGERAGMANVFPIGAVTKGRKGEELTEMTLLADAGAVAFSDDGSNIDRADVMKKALEYSTMLDKVIMIHAEDTSLCGGAMNAGFMSMKLGLPGNPAAAEDVIVARDIILSRMTGGRVHVCHVSSGASVELVRRAKTEGLKVTAEVTPHHLFFTDADCAGYDTAFKMAPPLRTEDHRKALLDGLRDGTIDCIASDHAPHTDEKKALSFVEAPFGVIGLETTLPVCYTKLVETKLLTLSQFIAALTCKPAKLLNLHGKGALTPGADADVTVIDTRATHAVHKDRFQSKCRNSPFHGMKTRGWATQVVVGGKVFHNPVGE